MRFTFVHWCNITYSVENTSIGNSIDPKPKRVSKNDRCVE